MLSEPAKKAHRFPPGGFRQLIPLPLGGLGCVVSDRITVDGEQVGYLYRQAPLRPGDSGWSILSGMETDDELGDASRCTIWTLNEVANFDRRLITLLNSPVGAAFVADPLTSLLVPDPRGAPPNE